MKFVKSAALAFAVLLARLGHGPRPGAGRGHRRRSPAARSRTCGLGVGLVIIGAAMGIGGLTKSAVESMARQPEMAANIQTAMIIAAALIEGVDVLRPDHHRLQSR